jgi:Spy/CpxP family protein refolding chaperone
MSSRLFRVLLALSLLLNAFFVAGFVFRGWIAPLPFERLLPPSGPRPGSVEMVTNEVDLDDRQRQALQGMIDRYSAARRERIGEIRKLREQIVAEYKRSPIDEARVDPLIERLGRVRVEQQKETLRSLAQVEAQLKPEQRAHAPDPCRTADLAAAPAGRGKHTGAGLGPSDAIGASPRSHRSVGVVRGRRGWRTAPRRWISTRRAICSRWWQDL